jgi:putative membrane protein
MMDNGVDGSWAIAGMVMMIAFWVGVVALAIWAIESFRPRPEQQGEAALDIARRRYAAGEISREEFEQIRRDLTPKSGTAA